MSTAEPPSVAVVMLTRDRLPYARAALASLDGTPGVDHWIMVDNGSADGSIGMLEEWVISGPGRRLVRNLADPGPAAARNQGVAETDAELVLFLDNDVLAIQGGWLQELVSVVVDRVVGAAPTLVFPGTSGLVQSAGGGVTRRGAIGLLHRGLPLEESPRGVRDLAWAPAAALLLRRDALLAAGGFDETFDPVALLEDVELCCRLRAAGGRLVGVGTSVLAHFEGTTFQHMGRDLPAYWHKHHAVIRRRWSSAIADGPLVEPEDVTWRPVVKDYRDLASPSVRLASESEVADEDLSFFRSDRTIAAEPPDVRVGIVGCGTIARAGVAPGFSPPGSDAARSASWFLSFGGSERARLVGVADVDRRRAVALAEDFGIRYAHGSIKDLLDLVPLECIAICTPAHCLAAAAILALQRGVHVIVEKPVATSVAELDRFLEVRRRFPLQRCAVDLPWRYHPAVQRLNDLVGSGVLGALVDVSATFEHGGPAGWAPDASWYLDPGCGGVVADLAPHVASVLQAVTGRSLEQLHPGLATPRRASAMVVLTGGLAGSIEVGWDAAASRFTVDLCGTEGAASIELVTGELLRRCRGERPVRSVAGGRPGPGTAAVLGRGPYRAFIDSVQARLPSDIELDAVASLLRLVLKWADATSAAV